MRHAWTVEKLEEIARNAILGGYGRVILWDEYKRDRLSRPVGLDPLGGRPRRLFEVNVAMDCTDFLHRELFARYSVRHGRSVRPITVVVLSRCRKCVACRRRRAMFWRGRAFTEYQNAPRSFFGTLTVSPINDVMIDALARIELAERGTDFDVLTDAEKFRVRCVVGGREVTKYLKRLREGEAGREKPDFRYLLVAEQHASAKSSELKRGRPHWHVLFHEVHGGAPLVTADEIAVNSEGVPIADKYGNWYVADTSFLRRQWHAGHSRMQLCGSPQAATYLTKYLTKEDLSVRIRASGRYGKTDEGGGQNDCEGPEKERDPPTAGNINDPQKGKEISHAK